MCGRGRGSCVAEAQCHTHATALCVETERREKEERRRREGGETEELSCLVRHMPRQRVSMVALCHRESSDLGRCYRRSAAASTGIGGQEVLTWGGATEEAQRGPVHLTGIHLHLPANEPPSIRRRNSHGTDRGERERERESARAS